MAEKIKRRYTVDQPEYEVYSKFFDKNQMASDILNGPTHPTVYKNFYDETGILTSLGQLIGVNDSNKFVERSGHTVLAYIPETQRLLANLEVYFEKWCDDKVAEGRKRPTKWPPHLLERKLKFQARLDVYRREEQALREALEGLAKEEETEQEKRVLAFGPQGNGRLRGGELVEIDGQAVTRIHGRLIITSKNSPYCGMLVSDYREFVSEPWCAMMRQQHFALTKRRKEEIAKTGFSAIKVPPSRPQKKLTPSSLPPWPEGIRNYLTQTEDDTSDESTSEE